MLLKNATKFCLFSLTLLLAVLPQNGQAGIPEACKAAFQNVLRLMGRKPVAPDSPKTSSPNFNHLYSGTPEQKLAQVPMMIEYWKTPNQSHLEGLSHDLYSGLLGDAFSVADALIPHLKTHAAEFILTYRRILAIISAETSPGLAEANSTGDVQQRTFAEAWEARRLCLEHSTSLTTAKSSLDSFIRKFADREESLIDDQTYLEARTLDQKIDSAMPGLAIKYKELSTQALTLGMHEHLELARLDDALVELIRGENTQTESDILNHLTHHTPPLTLDVLQNPGASSRLPQELLIVVINARTFVLQNTVSIYRQMEATDLTKVDPLVVEQIESMKRESATQIKTLSKRITSAQHWVDVIKTGADLPRLHALVKKGGPETRIWTKNLLLTTHLTEYCSDNLHLPVVRLAISRSDTLAELEEEILSAIQKSNLPESNGINPLDRLRQGPFLLTLYLGPELNSIQLSRLTDLLTSIHENSDARVLVHAESRIAYAPTPSLPGFIQYP